MTVRLRPRGLPAPRRRTGYRWTWRYGANAGEHARNGDGFCQCARANLHHDVVHRMACGTESASPRPQRVVRNVQAQYHASKFSFTAVPLRARRGWSPSAHHPGRHPCRGNRRARRFLTLDRLRLRPLPPRECGTANGGCVDAAVAVKVRRRRASLTFGSLGMDDALGDELIVTILTCLSGTAVRS